jgi:hypothetical protein
MKRYLYLFFISLFIIPMIFYTTTCSNPLYGVGDDTDVKDPKIDISSPSDAETVGRNFIIKGTAWDDKKLNKITIESDCIKTKEIKASSDWSVNIDINPAGTSLANQKFKITVSDKSGRTKTTYLNLTIDFEGPTVTLVSPSSSELPKKNGEAYSGNVDFKFVVTDNTLDGVSTDSSNNYIRIFNPLDPNNSTYITTGHITHVEGNNWIFTYNTGNKPEGIYRLNAYFYDNFGNQSNICTADIYLAPVSDKPTLTLVQPDPNANPCVKISKNLIVYGYANDNVSIDKIVYNIKDLSDIEKFNKTINADGNSLYTFYDIVDTSSIGLTNGKFKLTIHAEDNNGILSDEVVSYFEIDNSIPYLILLDSTTPIVGNTPINGKYINSDFTVDVQCDVVTATVQYKITQNTLDTGWNPWGAMSQTGNVFTKCMDFNLLYSTYGFSDGIITLRIKATKDDKIYEVTRTFYIDKTPPQISITSHVNNQKVNGAVKLSGTAYDNLGLGDKVEVFNPDPAINTWQDATNTTSWTYTVSTETSDIETKFNVTGANTYDALFRVRVSDKAGNTTIEDIHLIIDPSGDIPKVVLLDPNPSSSGMKVSGNLSVLCTMDDDDFPSKDMTGTIVVYDGATPVPGLSRTYTKAISGFPNMSMIIDTASLIDQKLYTLKVNGTDWHGKVAPEIVFDFIVDKNAPVIELAQPVTDSYKRNTINFVGKVKDENIISSLNLTYIDKNLVTQTRPVTLTPAAPESGKQVWTFNFTLNASGADTGLGGTNIDWGDDEWGNNPHLFTLRATDETGSMSYNYTTINLDNHDPTGNITYPEEGHIIDINGEPTEMLIKGGMNDTPSQGIAYPLNLNLIRIELWQGGAYHSIIKDWSTGGANFVAPSTAESFTYKWNHSAIPDGSYAVRLYVKDNTNSTPVMAKEVNIIKNAYPPIVETITFATKEFYRGVVSFNTTGRDRGTLASGNGVDKVDMLVDGVVKSTIEHNETTEISFNDNFNLDTTTLTDGTHEISFRVTDRSGLTNIKSAGNITVDNTPPVITTPTYYTLDYASPITNYSAYLGFTSEVNDLYSLVGDNPQFRITTDSGTQILNWSYFNSQVWDGQKRYTMSFTNYLYVFDYLNDGPLHIYIRSQDAAGNEAISEFQISKATALPAVAITLTKDPYISDVLDAIPGNDTIEISGTVDSSTDRLWIKVDSKAEVEIPGPFGSGTFSKSYTKTELPSGNHTFRMRAMKNGNQNILTKTITVDHSVPVVSISNIIVEKSGEGHVSTDYSNISGKVIYSGTYTDNLKDTFSKSDIKLQIKVGNLAWTNVPDANITQKTGASNPWTWTYEVDTEDLSILSTRVGILNVQLRASDKAENQVSTSSTKTVVPYIKSITSTNQTNYPVFDTKYYQNSTWANHENRRYSLAQGTTININGYNLDNTGNDPVVFLGTNTLSTTIIDHHLLRVTIPTNDTVGKSGDLYVRLSDGSVYRDSTIVALYIWKFNRIGDDYDTLDSRSLDMSLRSDGKAFVTFARDHQVTEYTGSINDYCIYRIDEDDTQAYNTYGEVDPMWFTANGIYGNYRYTASCVDEWTGREDTIIKPTLNTDYGYYSAATGGSGLGDYTPLRTALPGSGKTSSQFNTSKYGSLAIRETGSGNGTIYLAVYDDDSRATSPVPTLFLASVTLSGYDPAGSPNNPVYARRVIGTNNPGPWNGIALTSAGYPVIVYYTTANNKLNLGYNTSTFTPGDDSFTNKILTDGGKYCKIAIDNNNLISISSQDKDNNLSYVVLSNVTDNSPAFITLETMANDGITGFNTSICLDNDNKPYISYINNSQINTKSALHLARFTGSTVNKANLSTQSNWEYMAVPSPYVVNADNTVIRWYSGSNWPVIAYKANNYIYIARMVR